MIIRSSVAIHTYSLYPDTYFYLVAGLHSLVDKGSHSSLPYRVRDMVLGPLIMSASQAKSVLTAKLCKMIILILILCRRLIIYLSAPIENPLNPNSESFLTFYLLFV
jgi:hypothetical protein